MMKLKLTILGLVFGLITVSTIASVEPLPVEVSPIELEIQKLTISPAEQMLAKVLGNHPLALLADWLL
ncbi:hypothetical protein NBRC116188_13210 [Oceaniserpentilla sp. 4NH20-0058]|uniref:hypothetical protein n=1 Tax=Oceaniserpentilla sp. 4NH20-0058 TaxID=3127660 RepID=UPI003108E6FB